MKRKTNGGLGIDLTKCTNPEKSKKVCRLAKEIWLEKELLQKVLLKKAAVNRKPKLAKKGWNNVKKNKKENL
jgi:hypothetical protein